MSSSDELDVSVDAISTGPTPGQKLRLAREARGLSLDDVTAETNLSPKYLQALEADDYAALPGLAFARGYARRYAQLVHLDGSVLIAEMDLLAAAQGITAPVSLSASSSAMQRASVGISQVAPRKASDLPSSLNKAMSGLQQISMAQVLSLGSLVLLLLLLLGTLFWQGNNDTSTEPMADNGVIDIDADIAQQTPPDASLPAAQEQSPAAAVEAPSAEVLPATDPLHVEASPPASAAPASAAAPVPTVTPAATPAVAPAPVAAPVVAKARPAVPVVVAPVAAPAPAKPVPAAAAPVVIPVTAAPVPAAKAASVPPGIDSLNFSFTGKSWISVRDATGQELVYGLKNAGQAVTVTGQAPFSINIGNVNVTALSRNGRAVNLKQYARGEIASFRLAPSAPPKP